MRADREVFAADENSDAWKNPVSNLWAGADFWASSEESAGLRLVSSDKSAGRLDLEAGEHRLDGESSDRTLFFLPGAGEVVGAGSFTGWFGFKSTGGRSLTVTDLYLSLGLDLSFLSRIRSPWPHLIFVL